MTHDLGRGLIVLYLLLAAGLALGWANDGIPGLLACIGLVAALGFALVSAYHRGRSTAFRDAAQMWDEQRKQLDEARKHGPGNGGR